MKEFTVEEWFQEIDAGLKYRSVYGKEQFWYPLERAYYGLVEKDQEINSGANILLSTGDALLSSLSVPDPYITAKAKRMDFVQNVRLVESVVNSTIKEVDLPEAVEMATLHTYLWGKGIIKFGYDSEYGWDRSLDIGFMGQPAGMTLSRFDKKLKPIEFNNYQPGMPWAKAVCPHDIVVPWGTITFDDAGWVAHRVLRHIEDIRSDLKYSNTANLQPNISRADFMKSYESELKLFVAGSFESPDNTASNEAEYVELWEIRDRRTGKIYVVASGYDKFLRSDLDLLQVDGLPFVEMGFVPRARSFWTPSDAYGLMYHQAELKDISIQRTKHRRLMVLKFAYGEDAIDDEELEKALSAEVGVAFKVNGNRPLEEAIKPFVTTPPNQFLAMEEEGVRRNAREQVGFSRNQIGEYETTGRRTATEVNAVDESSSLRLDRRQGMIAKVYNKSARKLLTICRENWKLPRLIQVLDPQNIQQWAQITGDQLAGEYSFSTGFSVNTTESLQARKQFALQTFVMLMKAGADPVETVKFLTASFNDPEFTMIFKGVLNGPAQAAGGGGPVRMGGSGSGPQALPAPSAPGPTQGADSDTGH